MENFPNYAGYGQSPTVCVNHPDRVSYAQCGRCNRTICGECQTAQDAGVVCPECYRDLNGGASSPKRSFIARHWHITYTLILINVVVYGLQLIIPFRWMYNLGMMSGPRVHHGEYYRLITHGFVHSQNDPMHMVWNMIYLFIFGVSLERMMGRWKFLF
ncbi:rhomboid family intramembrane serine protease, partial [Rothia sp. HMSC065D09]